MKNQNDSVSPLEDFSHDNVAVIFGFNPHSCFRILIHLFNDILKRHVIVPVCVVHGKNHCFVFRNVFNIFKFNFNIGKLEIGAHDAFCKKILKFWTCCKVYTVQEVFIYHNNQYSSLLKVIFFTKYTCLIQLLYII